MKQPEAIFKLCEEIDRLESDADRVQRAALSKLFRDENDLKQVMKLRVIYDLLESITDRLKRMINCSGYKVWPAEVESMLYAHPAIQEACVIAARDGYRGETVKAVVVLKSALKGTSPKDIIDWARERMAAFKVPRQVEFVDELPKTSTGKILWRKLQEEEYGK